MKRILLTGIILLLNVFPAAAEGLPPMSDYEVAKVIEETLNNIKDGLKGIKTEFPQLANVDYAATITRNPSGEEGVIRFDYTKGFVQGSSIPKDGASISVAVKYPAALEDVRSKEEEGKLFSLGNGNVCVYWKSVRAEDSEPGKLFKSKVDQIILFQLIAMQRKLK